MRICEGWRLVALTWFNHIVACWSMVQHPHLCLWHFAGLLRLGPIGATWSMARSLQEKTSTRLGWQVKADRTLLAAQSGEKGLKKLVQGFWILEIYLKSCRKRRPCNPNKAWQNWHWKKGQKPAQALYQNKELVPAAAATAAPAARATGAEREMENWWTWGKHPPRQVTDTAFGKSTCRSDWTNRSDDMDYTFNPKTENFAYWSVKVSIQCLQDFARSILLVKSLKPLGPSPMVSPRCRSSPLIPGCHPAATLTPARSRFLDAPGGHGDEGRRGACYAGKSPRTMEV